MSQSWETLVAVALLGTDRQKALPAIAEKSVKTLLVQVDASDAEHWLLSAAGTLAAYQQAGQNAEKRTERLIESAEAEAPTLEEPAFLPFLRMIFTQDFQPALPEFLSLLHQSGQCIPPEYLPQLLDWGHFHPEVRSHLRPVIGSRGEWLARLNPKWRYAQATPQSSNPEEWKELWETSDRTVRINLLREWRSQNPEAARELVATTWKQDSAKDRAAFLECFAVGLTLADEGFLEKGLGDRSKDVKTKVIEILSQLPESRLSQQIGMRLKALVSLNEVKGKQKLEIQLPDLDDPQWQEYGLDASRLKQDMQGNRGALLLQLVRLAPLSLWTDFGSPQTLLELVSKNEWKEELTQGWLFAAQHQQNLDWSVALLDWAIATLLNPLGRWMQPLNPFRQLFSDLPQAIQNQWITNLLKPEFWKGDLVEILISNTYVLPLSLSHTVLATAQQYLIDSSEQGQIRAVAKKLQYLSNILHPDVVSKSSAGSFQTVYHTLQTDDFNRLWQFLVLLQQMRQVILQDVEPQN